MGMCGSADGGFLQGNHNAPLFSKHDDGIRMAVHGDDFIALPDDLGLAHLYQLLRSKFFVQDHGHDWV